MKKQFGVKHRAGKDIIYKDIGKCWFGLSMSKDPEFRIHTYKELWRLVQMR